MASGSEDAVEDALNVLVSVTKKSGNLRNDLRKGILEAVSNFRTEFARLKCEVEDKNKLIANLEMKAAETNSTIRAMDQSKDKQVNDNPWQRGYSCCLLLIGVSWNVGEQRL